MKILKRLIPVMLVAIMILAMASCDLLVPKKNDPEKNVEHIIEALNSGSAMNEIFASQNAADSTVTPEDMLSPESLIEFIKGIAIEGTVNTNFDGEAHSGYFGIKDGVIYAKEDKNEQYIFIEDDLKIVTVDKIYGDYYRSVNVELTQMFETLKDYLMSAPSNKEESDIGGKDETENNILANIELPEITAEDVTYDEKNDRYVLSEEYVNEAIETVIDEILRESLPDTSIVDRNAQKAAIMEYVKEMNVEFYFRAKFEKMLGFGASMAASDDLKQELGVEELALELYVGKDAINANIEYKYDGSEMKAAASVVMDDKGMPKSLTFKLDVLNNDYADYICVDNEEHDYREASAKQTLTIDLKADLTKREGEIVSFNYDQTISDYKIYTDNYWYKVLF